MKWKPFWLTALTACIVTVALLPATASADDDSEGGFVLRINGPFALASGDSIDSAVVIRGDAVIGGTVRDTLLVIDGHADIAGRVEGNVTIIKGNVTLEGGSFVSRVTIINGSVNRESGSVVEHGINRRGLGFYPALFFWLFWLGMTIAVVIAGLVVAAVAGRQLSLSMGTLTGELAYSILGAVALWIGLPAVAVLAFLTVAGIPFGLALLFFALPLLWFLGYLVTGARLGRALLELPGRRTPADHPYVYAALGLIILQIVVLVPVVGWAIGALAGIWGSGALAVTAFRAGRSRSHAPTAPAGET
ncbi:MAG TPA: hypothetical protein VM013_01005 [Dehalococcoidia bacterium]|nr:hypothetical protein [Dehalococcoidia bacterium]